MRDSVEFGYDDVTMSVYSVILSIFNSFAAYSPGAPWVSLTE